MPEGTSGHVCDFCVVARCLSAETSRLKQRSQVQYQECRAVIFDPGKRRINRPCGSQYPEGSGSVDDRTVALKATKPLQTVLLPRGG
jgi:hypothetical protein